MSGSSLLAASLALPLFVELPDQLQRGESSVYARVSPLVLSLEAGAPVRVQLTEDSAYTIRLDGRRPHSSGNVTLHGRVEDAGLPGQWFTLTGNAVSGLSGTLMTPQGEYRIEPAGSAWNDVRLVPVRPVPSAQQCNAAWSAPARTSLSVGKRSTTAKADSAEPTAIRVLVLYTDSARDNRTDAQWSVYLDDLFAFTNQIYENSRTQIRFERAGTLRVDASEVLDNASMLTQLTPASGSFNHDVFGDLELARLQSGAHFVMLLRAWHPQHPNCGIAHAQSCGDDAQCYSANLGYTVVSVGNCSASIVAHELGHLLGAAHQPGDGLPGNFSYSHGYINAAPVGTVMTVNHPHPLVALFSSPELDCQGQPCGVTGTHDNARTLDQVGHYVERWYSARSIALYDPPTGSIARGRSVPLNFLWFGVVGTRFDITLLRNGARVATLAENEPLPGGFKLLAIPSTLELGDGYRLRVASSAVPEVLVESGPLTLVEPGSAPSELAFAEDRITVPAGQTVVELIVQRSGGLEGAVIVDYATRDGTARAGTHYTANIDALAWEGGDGSTRSVFVQINAAAATGSDRTFTLELRNPSAGSVLGTPASVAVTIAATGGGGGGRFPPELALLVLPVLLYRRLRQAGV